MNLCRTRVFVVQGTAALVGLLVSACGFGDPSTNGKLTVPAGFEVEIAAGPPLVERPMIVDMDEQGRLYVAESSGSNDPVQQQLAEKPHSILRLEDADGDGRFDRRVVFADKMMFPEGVLWHDGSLYVAAPPVIWKLTDSDGDGRADRREEWFDAKTLTNCANDLHGPYLGPDGWIYWTKGAFAEQTYERPGRSPLITKAAHVFRRRPRGGPVEAVLTGGMDNPVEVAFTPEGERLLTSTFLQHPQLGRRDGILHAVYGGVYGKVHGVTDNHPMTGGYLPAMTHLGPAAPVGLARYRSSVFGDDYRNNLFATLFNMHKVTRHVLVPKGATYETEDSDFLVSDSSDFHPTDVMEDADGSLLVVDTGAWYKLCCPTSQLSKPDVTGAIYRVRRSDAPTIRDPRGADMEWDTVTAADLTPRLADERPVVRRRSIEVLAKKGGAAVPALAEVLASSASAQARRNAIWALTRIPGVEARAKVRGALADFDASVKHAAVHAVGVWRDGVAVEALLKEMTKGDDAPRRVSAEALGRIGDPRAVPGLLAAAATVNDEVLTHSLTFALIEIGDPRATRAGLESVSPHTRRAALLALDQMERRSLDPATVIPLLSSRDPPVAAAAEWIVGQHPEWGNMLSGYFRRRLTNLRTGEETALERQLGQFMGDAAIQRLAGNVAGRPGRKRARLSVLRVMAAAAPDKVPPGWRRALVAALASADHEASAAAVRAARKLPREELGEALTEALQRVARDERADERARVEALEATTESFGPLSSELFDFLVTRVMPDAPVEVRGPAARAMATVALTRRQLTKLAGRLGAVGPMELPLLVEAFAVGGDEGLGRQWIEALAGARGLANLRTDIIERVAAAYPRTIQEAARGLRAPDGDGREARQRRLEQLLTSLEPGDIRRGQAVFNSSEAACSSCHAIGYEGGRVGPDLTRIGEIREQRDLLESLVFPSASFVRSYEPLVVVTAADTYSGVPLETSETHMLLATGAEERVRLVRSRIEEVRPGTVSVMPAGLDEQMTEGELADLLAFLKATRWGPD